MSSTVSVDGYQGKDRIDNFLAVDTRMTVLSLEKKEEMFAFDKSV